KNHPSPYTIGWIKEVKKTEVTEQYTITFSFGKSYKDQVICDVIDIEACHMLLGRSWQYNIIATHRGRDNVFIFIKDGRKT
ncbi:hypothetical protein PJI17_32545, partial [Mycobacterium kansasii]